MMNIVDKEKCCGCEACYNVCPVQCINMEEDSEGFKYPTVDYDKCIKCNLCETVCPFIKYSPMRHDKPNTYVTQSLNDDIRISSSSGGVFSEIAEHFLNNEGVVYGVSMSKDIKSAVYTRITDQEQLKNLRGSKYLQVDAGLIFKQVKADLEKGLRVLFSGTPCQINALNYFLKKEYNNLILIDFICHGVPSPKLWKRYIEYLESKHDAKIVKIDFRNKKLGWKRFGLTKNGRNISQYLDQYHDPYMIMFLRNYSLRPSCYCCVAKRLESQSDITLADAWGIEFFAPNMDDDRGTSLTLVHTNKGEAILDNVCKNLIIQKVIYDDVIKYNTAYYMSCNKPVQRERFFNDLNFMDFKTFMMHYAKIDYKNNFKRYIVGSSLWKFITFAFGHRSKKRGGGHVFNMVY